MAELTNEQEFVIEKLFDYYKENSKLLKKSHISVGGYAGTGKTYLIAEFKRFLEDNDPRIKYYGVAFCCPTGKAASVLKKKLDHFSCFRNGVDFCGTIHRLMYYPIMDKDKKVIKGWQKKEVIGDYSLIIIDESSMVDRKLFSDIKSYHLPIIAIGDHGQLFPVSNDGFSLIKNPDYKLTKIHRQEEGNPIIDISLKVRETGNVEFGCYSNKVFKVKSNDKIARHIMENTDFMNQNIVMLTNSNRDRRLMNEYVRMLNNFSKNVLYPGEKIVCLNNNYHYGCMNGEIYTVLWVMECNKELYEVVVNKEGEDDLLSILAYKKSFGLESYDSLYDDCNKLKNYYYKNKKQYKDILSNDFVCFDYGYALSVHKSQGSSWEKVILFDRRNKYQDDDNYKRWLYTGVTRAEKSLLIVDGQYYTD